MENVYKTFNSPMHKPNQFFPLAKEHHIKQS